MSQIDAQHIDPRAREHQGWFDWTGRREHDASIVKERDVVSTAIAARNATVEYARFIAAIGIIAFHATGSTVGYFALPFFIALSSYFAAKRSSTFAKRARRVLVPFMIWSLIYAAARIAQAIFNGMPISSEFDWWMIVAGPAIHLWFLPFIFIVGLLAPHIAKCGLVGFGILAIACLLPLEFEKPFAQWHFAIPAMMVGIAAAHSWWAVAVVAVPASVALPHLVGCAAFLAAIHVKLKMQPIAKFVGSLSMTIYLVHPLVIAVVVRIVPEYVFFVSMIVSVIAAIAIDWSLPRVVGRFQRLRDARSDRNKNRKSDLPLDFQIEPKLIPTVWIDANVSAPPRAPRQPDPRRLRQPARVSSP